MEYKIIRTPQRVRSIISLQEIIFYIGSIEIYFTPADILYLERADEGGEHIHLPYCYVDSRWWKKGEVQYRNILNDKRFVDFIKKEGVYEATAFCQGELELEQWLKRSVYQFHLLDQLIRDYQAVDSVPLTEMKEIF